MRALEYDFAPVRWLASRHLGARVPRWAVGLSGLRLRSAADPEPPTPNWVPLRVRLCGICGTDIAMLRGRTGPQLSPFVSFPAVLGHEVLGVATAGSMAGRRVVLDPFLGCRTRGLPPCPACERGQTALCHRFADGALAPGMLLGYCRELPGGWAEQMVAHASQVHPVPDAVDDETAVLAEPLAVALHAVLAAAPDAGSRVLVIGAGTIGLCVLAALRLLNVDTHVVTVARHAEQRDRALHLGASEVVGDIRMAERLAAGRSWGAARLGLLGVRGFTGGYDRVFDAVGSAASTAGAFHLATAGGRVDLLGCSGVLPRLDLTPVWSHELQVQGFCGYGMEPAAGGEHTIALALKLLAARPDVPVRQLVTHRFPLGRYREALHAALFHRETGSVKVVFAPQED